MNKRINKTLSLFSLLFCGIAHATSVVIEPFWLKFDPINFDYPRDNFQITTLNQRATSEKPLIAPHDIAVKTDSELLEIGGRKLYATNLNGVGVALQVTEREINVAKGDTQSLGRVSERIPVSAELVIYDKLQSGVHKLTQQQIAAVQFGQDPYLQPIILQPIILQPTTLTVKQRTCELNEKTQTVKLQTVSTTDLASKGSEAYGGDFKLSLTCDENVAAHITFWDQQDRANHSSILSLDTTRSTASGVGLRLYRENKQPITFGEEWLFAENQLRPSQSFSVNYVNTDGRVSAGSVNAVATVTFSYR